MWGITEPAGEIAILNEATKSYRAAVPKGDDILMHLASDRVYPANSTT